MSDHFHIPSEFAEFTRKTLIICAGHREARVYLVQNNEGKELAPEVSDFLGYKHTDNEAMPGSEHYEDEHDRHHFCKKLAAYINHAYQTHAMQHTYVFVPEDMKKDIESHLEAHVQAITEIHMASIMHHTPMQVLERIVKLRQPQ